MLEAKFSYQEGGYLFLEGEETYLAIDLLSDADAKVEISGDTTDYLGNHIQDILVSYELKAGEPANLKIPVLCPRYGYYNARLNIISGDEVIKKTTGFGLTTPHDRSPVPDSCFGISCNYDDPERLWPLFARMGIRYLRTWDVRRNRHLYEKYGLYAAEQAQGKDMYSHPEHFNRYARYDSNSAYYYEKDNGDISFLMEHGNEFWEDHNLALLAEWHKSTGLARLEANPSGWYTNSGAPGCDINKLEVLYENGMFDYITSLCIHAYSFPGCPEGDDSYWSVSRLKDVAEFMNRHNIKMPVCCTEQGYPAMLDQTKCESYSPGEMSSLDGQADYLVRSWLIFLSMGVSKIIWFNGPWYDGFGILEKDGPAPWPAAMALAELIRAVDHADYVGDIEDEPGTYYKVFRNRDTGRLFGAIWHPVYYARSFMKEKNLSLDGMYYESEGKAKELFDYHLHDLDNDWYVKDIMGNKIDVKDETVSIGERPIYIYNISESVLSKLKDQTIFPVKQVEPKSLPNKIILGLTDSWPAKDWYLTSRFRPGDVREYTLRVHNFGHEILEDTIDIESPDCFKTSVSEIKVSVRPGLTETYRFLVTCDSLAPLGSEYKIGAKARDCGAHPVYQTAAVYCPIYFKPLKKPVEAGDRLTLVASTPLDSKNVKVEFISRNPGMKFADPIKNVTLSKAAPLEIPLDISECKDVYEPVIDVKLSDETNSVVYEIAIQTDYITYSDKVGDLSGKQLSILSGYNMIMTAGVDYHGPELFGTAKPEPLNSYVRVEADDKKLHFHFDIKDKRIVCAKNTRRNIIDSDGVWIRLFRSMEDEKPYRHFCVTPVDQAGQTKGCAVDEVSSDILFDTPYTDYDFSKIAVSSYIYSDGYTMDVAIERESIELEDMPKELIVDIRVINMDDIDWPKFYDTGKRKYSLLK